MHHGFNFEVHRAGGAIQETELLPLIQRFAEMARAFRDAMCRALQPNEGVFEPAWREAELIDIYQSEVQRNVGRAEEDLWEGGAEPEDDPLDSFARHCSDAYRRGWSEAKCAQRWRERPG
jgi:hypothetical protein